MDSNSADDLFAQSRSEEPQEQDPGGYPIPFRAHGILPGTRLDSIPNSLRYWAISEKRSDADWYEEMVAKNAAYEEWLCRETAGAYLIPFGKNEGKRLDEVDANLRDWAVHPDRDNNSWYSSFVMWNNRYEEELASKREPGDFPFPAKIARKYTGKPIKDIRQDVVWWGLRPENRREGWYKPLYEANRQLLDQQYASRSPGSEQIWFGTRYRGLRLDQAYRRNSFRWCLDPKRDCGWHYRLIDLVHRLQEWWLAHPERSGPRKPRSAPNVQNPVGEAIGSWDDEAGSAAEDEDYEQDDFVVADSDEEGNGSGEDDEGNWSDEDDKGDGSDEDAMSDVMDVAMQDELAENKDHEPDEETDEEMPLASPAKRQRSRKNVITSDHEDSDEDMQPKSPTKRHRNVVASDDEEPEDADDGGVDDDVARLGRRYRVPDEDSDDDRVQPRKSARLNHSQSKRRAPPSSQ